MSYNYTDVILAATKVAKLKDVHFHFRDTVTTEQEFKDNIRFYNQETDWYAPDWENPDIQQPLTWEDVEEVIEETIVEIKTQECKLKAKQLLTDSDWSVTPDVQASLQNPLDWINYRESVRRLFLNPVANASFPTLPEVRWNI